MDDDGVGPCNVDAALDDSRGHQHIRVATAESVNAEREVCELPMRGLEAQARKAVAKQLDLTLDHLDPGHHVEHLPASRQLELHCTHDLLVIALANARLHGHSTHRRCCQVGDAAGAVGHRVQRARARDGRCREQQHICGGALKLLLLTHAK